MSSSYRLFVFDWEGTIVDPFGQLIRSIIREAEQLGLPETTAEDIKPYVEQGLLCTLKKVYPDNSASVYEQLIQNIQLAMIAKPQRIYLLPGVEAFIKKLHANGHFLAIASNKGRHSLERALHSSDLATYFHKVQSASNIAAKPNPQMLLEILDFFNVEKQQALMIGDSILDIEMASAIEVDSLGIDYYHLQTESLIQAGAKRVFEDYAALEQFLLKGCVNEL